MQIPEGFNIKSAYVTKTIIILNMHAWYRYYETVKLCAVLRISSPLMSQKTGIIKYDIIIYDMKMVKLCVKNDNVIYIWEKLLSRA
jgi:hypothetical protein